VNEFKAKNNIIELWSKRLKANAPASPQLTNELQLAELNGQLSAARIEVDEAGAKLSRIEAILRAKQPAESANASVSDALNNPIINSLRPRYLELVNREANWSRRLGPNHLAVVNVRNQIEEIRRSIHDELERIAETYKSNFAIVKLRQKDIEERLTVLLAESQGLKPAQVLLRDLESSAESYRTLYDNFVQHYAETIQRQSFPVTETRLISPADNSVETNRLRALKVLTAALIGGIGCGAGLALLRELLDHVFRTSGQIQGALDVDCLALVPSIQDLQWETIRNRESLPSNIIDGDSNPFRVVIESPFSRFTEAIRAIKLAADQARDNRRSKVLAFTSAIPGEGKSTIARALAHLIAKVGNTVILVDCDLRNPTLSRVLAPKASCGFVDVVSGSKSLEQSIWKDSVTSMAFLPAGKDANLAYTIETLASNAANNIFDKLRKCYDYVIVDLSPLVPVVDARATNQLVDEYVMIVKWGSTKIDVVQHGLNTARGIQRNLLGVVLNQADLYRQKFYEGHRAKYCYNT
jgi:succinoglycan biosynthesis transport protein ExoP